MLITLDTLRYDAFAGGEHGPPSLVRLAELAAARGATFERHYAASSSTQPTHASLLTGVHPWEHGVVRNGMVLEGDHPTLAEILREAGYWTAAAVGSFPVAERFGFGRGFMHFDEEFDRAEVSEWNEHAVQGGSFYRLADRVTDTGLALLESAPVGDQFLWLHYFDPHAPYGDAASETPLSGPDLVRRFKRRRNGNPLLLERVRRLYSEDVAFLDEHLARLIEGVLVDDRFKNHVVVTADHGENLGEDSSVGHGNGLSEAEVHVPLVVLSPRLAAGERRSEPCGSTDVFVTLLDLARVEGPPSGGRSLLRPTQGRPAALGMRRVFEEPQNECLVDGSVRTVEGYRFYVLDADRIVRGNGAELAVEGAALEPAAERDLQQLFRTIEQALESLDSTEMLDTETQETLKALGYVR